MVIVCYYDIGLATIATSYDLFIYLLTELIETDLSVQATASLLGTSPSENHNKILERSK